MSLPDLIAHCVKNWADEGIAVAPPKREAEIRQLWRRLGREVSDDVVTFYTTVGGFKQYEFVQDFFWSLWPWEMLAEKNIERPTTGVRFCCHSVELETWELRAENAQVSSVWSSYGYRTAPTLESFLEIYLDDPWRLI